MSKTMKYRKLLEILDDDILAECMNIPSYETFNLIDRADEGYRPQETFRRLDFLCEVITALEGTYTYFGINRWFGRKRAALGNKSPLDILSGDWRPEDKNPQKVLNLAKRLLTGTIAT